MSGGIDIAWYRPIQFPCSLCTRPFGQKRGYTRTRSSKVLQTLGVQLYSTILSSSYFDSKRMMWEWNLILHSSCSGLHIIFTRVVCAYWLSVLTRCCQWPVYILLFRHEHYTDPVSLMTNTFKWKSLVLLSQASCRGEQYAMLTIPYENKTAA